MMIIVVDVNPLFSALLKEATSRDLIVKSGQDFCFPEHSLHKIRKYQGYLLEKTGFSELELAVMLHSLLQFIRIIPTEEILSYWEEAKKIMGHIDPEDVTIMATALSQGESVIWSNDQHFDRQERIPIFRTKEMVELFLRH